MPIFLFQLVSTNLNISLFIHDKCHMKIDLFMVQKVAIFSILNFCKASSKILNYYCIFGIKIIRNPTGFQEIIILVNKLYSISTMIEQVKPYFEPWKGRFSRNTHSSHGLLSVKGTVEILPLTSNLYKTDHINTPFDNNCLGILKKRLIKKFSFRGINYRLWMHIKI